MLKGRYAQPSLYVCLALIVAFAGVSIVIGTVTPATAVGFGLLIALTVSQIVVVRRWRRGTPENG